MKLTGVSLSLLVAVGPAAGRCDAAGRAPAVAAADTAQTADTRRTAEDLAGPANARAAENQVAAENAQPPDNPPATESAQPDKPPAAQNAQPPDDPATVQNAQVTEDPSTSVATGDPIVARPPPGPWPGVEAIAAQTETTLQPDPGGAPGPGEYAGGDDGSGYDDADPSALTDFRSALDPYGTWADDPTVGTLWIPSADVVGPDFRPYVTGGHWTFVTDWIWASDYPWGWAPFHYGRWIYLRGRGWSWVPGRAYRGAWVVWSVDSAYSYVGWAPMAPLFLWVRGVAVAWEGTQHGPRWVVCPRGSIFALALGTRVVVGAAAAPLASRMQVLTVSPGTVRSAGPLPERLGYSGTQVPRPVGAAAVTIARAVQFARPSTALALGARAPSRATLPTLAPGGGGVAPGARSSGQGGAVPVESGHSGTHRR